VQDGTIRHTNCTAWLNHTDVLNPNNAELNAMLNTTNSMGQALEMYFVREMENGDTRGLCTEKGIVIAENGDDETVAHEVFHASGLKDIYTAEDAINGTNPVTGGISEDRLPDDWGGGYYPPGLTQEDMIGRIIMKSGGAATPRRTLPRGKIYGWKHTTEDGNSPKTLGMANVGQESIKGISGSH